MSNCSPLESISIDCSGNLGGIRRVWLWDTENEVRRTEDPTTYLVTGLGITNSTPGLIESFEFTRESSNYTEEVANDLVNGSTVTTLTLNLMFNRRTALKSRALKLMASGQRFLNALIEDENGLYWVPEDLQLSAITEGSGTAKTDANRYAVTLVAKNADLMYGISGPSAVLFVANGTV